MAESIGCSYWCHSHGKNNIVFSLSDILVWTANYLRSLTPPPPINKWLLYPIPYFLLNVYAFPRILEHLHPQNVIIRVQWKKLFINIWRLHLEYRATQRMHRFSKNVTVWLLCPTQQMQRRVVSHMQLSQMQLQATSCVSQMQLSQMQTSALLLSLFHDCNTNSTPSTRAQA